MLLTNKAEILEAMNEEIAEASASSVKWLADTFNVPLTHKKKSGDLSTFIVSCSGMQYVLKLSPDDILQLEKQNKAFPVKLHGRKNKYSEHRRLKRRLTHK